MFLTKLSMEILLLEPKLSTSKNVMENVLHPEKTAEEIAAFNIAKIGLITGNGVMCIRRALKRHPNK